MEPLKIHTGQVIPIDRANVDTDQIIPKQFLKRIERTGYGDFLFNDWRYDANGKANPEFVLNQDPYRNGTILLARKNFGCGSSREHAAWSIMNYGIRVVIAPSFADIFHSNAANNGLLTVILPEETVDELFRRIATSPNHQLTVNVETLTVSDDSGWSTKFPLSEFRQHCLLNGLDQIGLTLQHEQDIRSFEECRAQRAF